MLADKLRKAVLQAAIQGRLTKQLLTDGNAADLVAEIKKEKERLIKEKKIKKQKPLPEITEEEIPFEIPDNWCWVRLGDISNINIGLTFKPTDISSEGTIVLRSSNIQKGKITLQDTIRINIETPESKKCYKNDLLICVRNGSKNLVGKTAIIENDGFTFGAFMAICRSKCYRYLYYYLSSPLFRGDLDNVSTTTINQITQTNLKNRLVPLPPLKEQQRIAECLLNVLYQIEKLEINEEKLSLLQKNFPDKLKKSLLQAAIQGKLTEQLSTDDNVDDLLAEIRKEKEKLIKEKKIKKQKFLPPITEEEIPFEIPENWRWVRAYDILDVRDGTHDTPKYVIKGIPLVTSKNLDNGKLNLSSVKYISQEDAEKINIRSKVDINDILFAMIGTIGNPVIIKENIKMSIKNIGLFKVYNNSNINMDYIYYVLLYMQDILKQQISSGVQKFVSLTDLRKMVIPLPPTKEQQFIVKLLNQMLLNIDKLKME